MARVIREMIEDPSQFKTSIPMMKILIEKDPNIVDKEIPEEIPLLERVVQKYTASSEPYKSQYFEIIKLIIPHSKYKISTADYELASYLLEQRKPLKYYGVLKPELFFPPAPLPGAYVVIGHSTETGKPISVPPGCTYVVATLCGDSSDTFKFQKFVHARKDKLIEYAMEGNHMAMSHELKFPCAIYKEGEEITEIMFDLPAIYTPNDTAHSKFILPGGLMPIENASVEPLKKSPHLLRDSYANSVFPSLPILESLGVEIMTRHDLRSYPITVSLSQLFEHYPGIHFMIACRETEHGEHSEPVKLRRTKSMTRRHSVTLEKLKTMDDDTLLETLKLPIYFIEDKKGDIKDYLLSKGIDIDLRDKIVMRGGKRTRKRSRFQQYRK